MTPRPTNSEFNSSLTDPDATLPPDSQGADAPRTPTGRFFGDYELLEEIARGGMGVVYKARQVSLNRMVALKMILAGQLASESDVQRFRLEAEAAANLDHPNILPIHEVGAHLGQHYFSMKYVEGGTLANRLALLRNSGGAGDSHREAARLIVSVSRAVHFAHQRGILHRDIKPGNVLIDRDGAPYVTDFGLAKRADGDSGLTQTGAIIGTPSYMAPEQASSPKDTSTAADIYALGAVLYEALTGRPPFRAGTAMETILQVINEEPVTPRSINLNVDSDLETIALKCLAKEPSRRYATAGEIADELERWQRGESIQARPSGTMEKAWRWAKRRPLIATLTAATAFFFVTGTIGMSMLYGQSEWHRKKAEDQLGVATKLKEQAEENERAAQRYVYASNLNLAGRAWETGDARQVKRLLNQAVPAKGQADLRGFEWHYFRNICDAATSTRHLRDNCKSARLLAGGQFAITSHEGAKELTLWNTATGQSREVRGQFFLGCCSKPDPNGGWTFYTGELVEVEQPSTEDQPVLPKQFRKRKGRMTVRTLNTANENQQALEVQIDCPLSRSPANDGTRPDVGFALAPEARVLAVLANRSAYFEEKPDTVAGGLRLVTGPPIQFVVRWHDLANGSVKEVASTGMHMASELGSPYGSPVISVDGQKLAVMGMTTPSNMIGALAAGVLPKLNSMQAAIFRTDRRRLRFDTWTGAMTLPLSGGMMFSPDGSGLIAGGQRNELRWLDAKSGQERGVFRGHSGTVVAAAFSPDGTKLVTGSTDLTLRVWDTKSFSQLGVFPGHTAEIKDVVWTADGKSVYSIDRNGQVKMWSVDQPPGPRVIAMPVPLSLTAQVGFLGFLADGRTLLVDTPDLRAAPAVQTKALIDSATGQPRIDIPLPLGNVLSMANSGETDHILLGHNAAVGLFGDRSAKNWRAWNPATGATRDVAPTRFGFNTHRIISYDGALIARVDYQDDTWTLRLSSLIDGTERELNSNDESVYQHLLFSSDSKLLVAVTSDGHVLRWNTTDGSEMSPIILGFSVRGDAVLTPDNTKLIIGDESNRLHFIDVRTGRAVLTTTGMIDSDRTLLVTPDGKRVIVFFQNSARNTMVAIFSVDGGQEVATLSTPNADAIRLIALNPQGTRLAARTENAIYVWDGTPAAP